MRRFTLAVGLCGFLFFCRILKAQVDPMLEQGVKPFGAYSTDFESISMVNGGLSIHLPLFSYPQRGNKLSLNLQLEYMSSGWSITGASQQPPIIIKMADLSFAGFKFDEDQRYYLAKGCLGAGILYWPEIVAHDGANHQLGLTGSSSGGDNFESVDVTGFQLTKFPINVQNLSGTLTDRSGIQYSVTSDGSVAVPLWLGNTIPAYSKLDPNGNSITFNPSGPGWTDTLGRTIPPPPLAGGNLTTDTSGCKGLFPISAAYLWNIPGPSSGTTELKVCVANVLIQTNFFPSDSEQDDPGGQVPMIQTVIVYNGSAWTTSPAWVFEYNDRDAGDPSGVNYGSLTKITFPTGGTISYTYASIHSIAENFGRAITTKTVNANDGTGAHVWNYAIGGGATSFTSSVTDPVGNDTVYTLSAVGYNAYYPIEVDYYQGSHSAGSLVKTVKTDYRSLPLKSPCSGTQTGAVDIAPIRVTTIWPNGQQTKTETDYDSGLTFSEGTPTTQYTVSYGNATSKREYDYAPGAPGSLLRTTTTNYKAFSNSTYLTDNLLSLPSSVQVTNGSGSTVSNTTFGYDETGGVVASGITTQHGASPYGSTPGNQTSIQRQLLNGTAVQTTNCPVSVSSGGYLVTSVVYFDTGTVNVSKDPCLHSTTYAYSSSFAGAYPTQVTNALGQITGYNYDPNTGLLTSKTDPNNKTITYGYENLWRLSSIAYPDGGSSVITRQETSIPFTATLTQAITSTQSKISTDIFDGLGRVSEHQLQAPICTIKTDYAYDAIGRKASVSNPYCSSSDSTYGFTSFQYDPLNRTKAVTKADGSVVSTAYCGSTTLVTDEAVRWRRSNADGLGRLIEVDEPNSLTASVNPNGCPGTAEPIWITSYTYDALDDLIAVTQNGSRQRSFTYDSFSHLATSMNPEISTPSGQVCSISYGYDADRNLISKTSPAPNQTSCSTTVTTTYSYEPLHRLTGKSYSNGDPAVTYTYDTHGPSNSNIGHRTGMTDAAGTMSNPGTSAWNYDSMGRVKSSYRHTNGALTDVNYSYNLLGEVTVQGLGTGGTFTGGRSVDYTYDNAGQVVSAVDPTNSISYASGATYAPPGGISALTLGQAGTFAGINFTNTYNKRLQPTELKAWSTAGTAFDLTYCFTNWASGACQTTGGNNGNVNGITNNLYSARTQAFTYDQLNRIATATAGTWSLAFGYDPWANLLTATATGTATPLNLTVNANNHVTTAPFAYDAAGNLVADVAGTYTWNAEGQLISAGGVTYTYDGDGHRVEKSNGKIYWYGKDGEVLYESDLTGNMQDAYVYFGGKRIAHHNSSSQYFYYAEDFIGSSRVITTSAGATCYDADFYPYGAESNVTNTCPQNYKWTGKERDAETGNDDFDARYYSSVYGRFLSADWSAVPAPVPYANPTNPQTLNLYAIVRDNPESYADLDGHCDNPGCLLELLRGIQDFGQHPGSYVKAFLWGAAKEELSTVRDNIGLKPAPELQPSNDVERAGAGAFVATANAAAIVGPLLGENEAPSPVRSGTDFVVTPHGEAIPIPDGAVGPTPTQAPGVQYQGGAGGKSLDSRVTGVRIMEPNKNQGARVSYNNKAGQKVDPATGRTVPNSDPAAHIPLKPPATNTAP